MIVMHAVKEFLPSEKDSVCSDAAITIFNSVGSNASQDTGRVAEEFANRFNRVTFAVDRPRPDIEYLYPEDVAVCGTTALLKQAQFIRRRCEERNIPLVISAGQSAGGRTALEFGKLNDELGDVSIAFVYASEPVGWYKTTPQAGFKEFKTYQSRQAALLREDATRTLHDKQFIHPYNDAQDLSHFMQFRRGLSIATQFGKDRLFNGVHWSQPAVPEDIKSLIAGGVRAHVDVAEVSMVYPGDCGLLDELVLASNGLFSADRVAHTTHSSFDSRDFLGSRIAATTKIATGIDLLKV